MEGGALLMGVDRILDMARTGCNLIGNCVAAVIIARWEEQLPEEALEIGYLQAIAIECEYTKLVSFYKVPALLFFI